MPTTPTDNTKLPEPRVSYWTKHLDYALTHTQTSSQRIYLMNSAILVLLFTLSLMGCAGADKDIIAKQREGISYPVSYQTAFQATVFALTKKGIAINAIDKENGLITTLPQQIREEKYVYQIAVRLVSSSETTISVMCNWAVSPGVDVAFIGIPSAIARSKSKNLEIEMADDIRKEIARMQAK